MVRVSLQTTPYYPLTCLLVHNVMACYVERGEVPGLVTLISRWSEVHVESIGMKAAGGSDPLQRDTIVRIGSMTKPITAVAAMILVPMPGASAAPCPARFRGVAPRCAGP
jgi:CubicO group peptidase (beta-lactamase class C family)